jgi:hypothetical protein
MDYVWFAAIMIAVFLTVEVAILAVPDECFE